MPAEYKKHQWLVYTASTELRTVGWPLAIAEAQASGVGVVMANIRADIAQYVGSAGFVYDTFEEVHEIVRQSFDHDQRLGRRGFRYRESNHVPLQVERCRVGAGHARRNLRYRDDLHVVAAAPRLSTPRTWRGNAPQTDGPVSSSRSGLACRSNSCTGKAGGPHRS